MTRIPTLLGDDYDDATNLPSSVDGPSEKRRRAQRELERAESAGDGDVAELMW